MYRIIASAIATAGLFFSGTSAHANLTFTSGQADSDTRYIIVTGKFEVQDDLSRFTQVVLTTLPTFVTFHSPGGSTYKAMELGRLIRQYGLSTVELNAGIGCASACTLAFLGGVQRIAEAGSIGVHRSSFVNGATISGDVATAAVQQGTADVISYMNAMGADPSLLQVAYSYDAADMRYLSSSEMTQYRVTTAGGGIADFNTASSAASDRSFSRTANFLGDSFSNPTVDRSHRNTVITCCPVRQNSYPEGVRLSSCQCQHTEPSNGKAHKWRQRRDP